jgi:DNA (cytosine-5)-methyltransferase 1
MDDADRPRLERSAGQGGQESGDGFASAGETFWADCEWIPCRDGKVRPIEPGTLPLAHGVPRRVEQVRSFGNAIVPQVAAEFIKSSMIADEEAKRWLAWRRKHLE